MAHPSVSLPRTFVAWLWPYLDAFSGRTRSTAALAVDAVLTVGPRTVSNLLRTLGLAGEPGFAAFHRVRPASRGSIISPREPGRAEGRAVALPGGQLRHGGGDVVAVQHPRSDRRAARGGQLRFAEYGLAPAIPASGGGSIA